VALSRNANFPPDFHLILASRSPRRHSLLRDIGVPFRSVLTRAEEIDVGSSAKAVAERNALAKAQGAVLPADTPPGAFVLATDTVVALEGRIMGKPASAAEATEMLYMLSGRTHQVVSAVALLRLDAENPFTGDPAVRVATALTKVTFLPLEPAQVEAYVATGEWQDKAGGYAVQGLASLFVSELRGEYTNVVGLPLCLLARLFREAGFDLLQAKWVKQL